MSTKFHTDRGRSYLETANDGTQRLYVAGNTLRRGQTQVWDFREFAQYVTNPVDGSWSRTEKDSANYKFTPDESNDRISEHELTNGVVTLKQSIDRTEASEQRIKK